MSSEPILAPISHDEFVSDILTIAERLEADDWHPDFLVGVGRGGLAPGSYLSHATGLALLSVDVSAQVERFGSDLLVEIAAKTRAGERLLIVDDINDSGKTIAKLRQQIADAGGVAENVRVAVLLNNVRSVAVAEYWAREIDRSSDKRWFVFPWEAMARRETLVAESAAVPERLA